MKKFSHILACVFAAGIIGNLSSCTPTTVPPSPPAYVGGGMVEVTGGFIQGTTNEEGTVSIYKGIPYAESPVGELRFKAPKDLEGWGGIKDCTLWGANAMQGNIGTFSYWTEEFIQSTNPADYQDGILYSEDCLTLNVWSDHNVSGKPVLVFIHGGGYNSGGASCPVYDGEELAKQGVVVVTIQYRVGVFGYLATKSLQSEEDGAGNFGLLDQIKALEWVRDNIGTFGGDPNRVTVMGQSAGAGSVNALLCSPKAQGLFSAAVSASKNNINQNFPTLQSRISNAPSALANKSADALREMDANTLNSYSITNNGPVIDGSTLMSTYRESILNKSMADVPLMSGMVGEDNLLWETWKSSAVSYQDTLMTLQNNIVTARKNAGQKSDTFLYLFNHPVPQDHFNTPDAKSAKHSYDLAYFFGNFADNRPWTDADRELSKQMMSYLVHFCKTGNPNANEQTWQASTGDYSYMQFENGCSIERVGETQYVAVNNHYKLHLG